MGNYNAFIERMKKEKEGFAEVWENTRELRDIVDFLIYLRIFKNLTQEDLAELSGLEQSAISRIERGKTNLQFITLNKIAKAMGYRITLEEIKK